MDALHLAVLQFILRLRQPLLDAIFLLCAAVAEPLFEDRHAGWCDEDVAGGEGGGFYLFDALLFQVNSIQNKSNIGT